MKTGLVSDLGDGGEPYLEDGCWTPWLYHAPEDEIEQYYEAASALMMKLERMPAAVRARLDQIEFRCPPKGCLLAKLYWMPRRPTAEEIMDHRRRNLPQNPDQASTQFPERGTYFYVGRTAGGTEVYDIAFYGFSRTPKDAVHGCTCCRMVYWRAGCRHGTASLERNAMLSKFSLAKRRHLLWESEEEALAKLPEHEKTLWGKRVFHPEPSAWHPKKRQGTGNGLALRSSRISNPSGGRR
jgi:hypothetical protein